MIQQTNLNSASTVSDQHPVTTPSAEPQGRWQGLAIRSAIELVRSFNPFYYAPPNAQTPLPNAADSAAGIDFSGLDDQTSHSLQFTSLAGRAIAAYANLPPEINQGLGYLASLVGAGQFARELSTFTAPAGPEPGIHEENETPQNAEGKTRKASQKPRQQPDKSATATLTVNQLPDTSLALGALVGLCTIGASSASDSPVEVANATALGKICQNEESCSKTYRLTANINGSQLPQPIGNETLPFTGELDGGCYQIFNLPDCLAGHLSGNGSIHDLLLGDANIQSNTSAGVAACKMSDNATISNIRAERVDLATNGGSTGIGAGIVNGGSVANITGINCSVDASGDRAHAGIAVGRLNSGIVTGTTVMNCTVTTSGESHAGIGAGYQDKGGVVTNTKAVNCNVKTSDIFAHAGIGAGFSEGIVNKTTAVNCHVETEKKHAYAGIGAGLSSKGVVYDTTAVNCTVTTSGREAYAGIGASYNTGTVTNTTAVNCTVTTSGIDADTGIGAGKSDGRITDTTALNCNVTASGENANAGIGAGYNSGTITDTRAFDTFVNSTGKASITGGINPVICTVTLKGKRINDSFQGCRYDLANEFVTPSLLIPDCQTVGHVIDTSSLASPTAELATTLSVSGPDSSLRIAGIALGAVFFALVGCACAYLYYRQGSSALSRPQPDENNYELMPREGDRELLLNNLDY